MKYPSLRTAVIGILWASTSSVQAAPPIEPVPRQGDPALQAKWSKEHEGFVQTAKGGGVDLLFLGDSITHRWPKKLLEPAFAPLRVETFGIEGDLIENLEWRILHGELDGIEPKVIVLLIGSNNLPRPYSTDQITASAEEIVKTIQEKLPATKVLLIGILPRNESASDPLRERIRIINESLVKLDDGKNVRFLNVGDKLTDAGGVIHREIMPDFIHPSGIGYQLWLKEMTPVITQMVSTSH